MQYPRSLVFGYDVKGMGYFDISVVCWLSGRASPCQGEGREFESRRPLE
jgi:hypothetical protein